MKIKTRDLKDAITRAVKGASFNSTVPLTSLMGIELKDSRISFTTTDITNYISIFTECLNDATDDFNVTVDASTLSKLVLKLTLEETKIKIENGNLVIACDGTYKLPIICDENGQVIIKKPGIRQSENMESVRLSSVMSAYNVNRTSIAKSNLMPSITGYYCDENGIITTDATIITKNDSVLIKKPVMISPQMMSLLTLNTQENIPFTYANNALQFVTDDCIITGPALLGIEDFPINEINGYFSNVSEHYCIVNKNVLLASLDRLSLFVEPYDRNEIKLSFGNNLTISSKKSSSVESISYLESTGDKYDCAVGITYLTTLLQSARGDNVKICYGNDNALIIESENVTQVLALMTSEE